MSADPPLGLCPVHPTKNAWRTCVRCGRFLCAECANPTGEGPRCPECFAQVEARPQALSGWLLLPLLSLGFAPIFVVKELVTLIGELRQAGGRRPTALEPRLPAPSLHPPEVALSAGL